MSETYHYSTVALSGVSSALSSSTAVLGKDGDQFVTAGTVNSIMAVSEDFDPRKLEELIVTLSLVHPNRTFVYVVSPSAKELTAECAAVCHRVSQTEHVCSEVIRIKGPIKDLPALLSVLKANLLTGMPSELLMFDSQASMETLAALSSITETIIFDSGIFEGNFSTALDLMRTRQTLVDLEWVKLGVWRDLIKDIFDNRVWLEYLPRLTNVSIDYVNKGSSSSASAAALLLAGWFVARLSAQIKGVSKEGINLLRNNGQKVLLQLKSVGKSDNSGLGSINFGFNDSSGKTSSVDAVKISAEQNELIANLDLGGHFRTSRPIEEHSDINLMKRFFFIGESTINYLSSLKSAIEISANSQKER